MSARVDVLDSKTEAPCSNSCSRAASRPGRTWARRTSMPSPSATQGLARQGRTDRLPCASARQVELRPIASGATGLRPSPASTSRLGRPRALPDMSLVNSWSRKRESIDVVSTLPAICRGRCRARTDRPLTCWRTRGSSCSSRSAAAQVRLPLLQAEKRRVFARVGREIAQ